MAAATAIMSPTTTPPKPMDIEQQIPNDQRPELPRPYKCTMCDKAFHRLEHQTRHIRTHTGEKPHACTFPGCTKKFSRSDELTRHTRIHNNPNSRRGKQQAHHAVVAAAMNGGHLPDHHHMAQAHVMPPPSLSSYSRPGSGLSTPNVSPPHTYSQHVSAHPSHYGSFSGNGSSPEAYYPNHQQHAPSMNILAHAASRAAEHDRMASHQTAPPAQMHYSSHPYYLPGQQQNDHQAYSARNGLSAYHYTHEPSSNPPSLPMSRSHSQDEDMHYGQRPLKRSRPGSPYSTNPPSPTFSTSSISPDSGYTPAMTPGHSPHIRAAHKSVSENHLPGIRDLTLAQMHSPALEPLEPATQASGSNTPSYPYSRSQNNSSARLRISELINKPETSERTLPAPAAPGPEIGLPSISQARHDPMEM